MIPIKHMVKQMETLPGLLLRDNLTLPSARDLGHRHQRSLRRLSRNVCRVFSVILRKACKLSIQSCCMPLVVTGRSVSKSRKDHPVGCVSFLWSKGLDAASEEVCLWCLFSDNDWDKQFGGYIVCMVSCCMDASRGRSNPLEDCQVGW